MRNGMSWFLSLATLAALLVWTSAASAFWPILQDVFAAISTSGGFIQVGYEVLDPFTQKFIQYTESATNPVQLTIQNGIVAWLDGSQVNCRVFDPKRYTWMPTADSTFGTVVRLRNQGGVVAWLRSAPHSVGSTTYDPAQGAWITQDTTYPLAFINDVITQDGVVAWVEQNITSNYVRVRIYNPQAGQWDEGSAGPFVDMPIIAVQNATVSWGTSTLGYDPSNRQWSQGNVTRVLAWFVAQPTSGSVGLRVCFTDMSIAGTGWNYDFGDNTTSTQRSDWHFYRRPGVFTAAESVTGAGSLRSSNAARTITIHSTPAPYIQLLLGD